MSGELRRCVDAAAAAAGGEDKCEDALADRWKKRSVQQRQQQRGEATAR